MKKYYNSSEAASVLGCTVAEVCSKCRSGELRGFKRSRKWYIIIDQPAFRGISTSSHSVSSSKYYYKYIRDDDHSNILINKITGVKTSLEIACANFKNLYVKIPKRQNKIPFITVLEELLQRNVLVNVLCSSIGADSRDGIADLQKKYPGLIGFKSCPLIHMKLFIFDNSAVYIGSANLTNAALGYRTTKQRNFESGILTNDPSVVRSAINHHNEAWSFDSSECLKYQNGQCDGC